MMIRCGFCGGEYDPEVSGHGGCAGCGMHKAHKGCSLTKCPACGYDNPLPPKGLLRLGRFFSGLRRRRHRGEKIPCDASAVPAGKTLADLKTGESGVIACLRTEDAEALDRMMSMSVMPGMTVTVIQDRPSCVFAVGRSRFAVDRELARIVLIRPAKTP